MAHRLHTIAELWPLPPPAASTVFDAGLRRLKSLLEDLDVLAIDEPLHGDLENRYDRRVPRRIQGDNDVSECD
jgi:hypothetical protein